MNVLIINQVEVPLVGPVTKQELMLALVLFFILFIVVIYIISKMRKRNLTKIQLARKPYSAILDDDEEYVSKGYEMIYKGKIDEAIINLNKAIKLKPENEDRYLIRGKLKLQTNDFNGALADFSKALTLKPDFAAAFFYRSQVKSELGDSPGAEKDLIKAEEFGFKSLQKT